jgi:hypothetical protein
MTPASGVPCFFYYIIYIFIGQNDTAIQPMTSGPVTSTIGVPFLQPIIYIYIFIGQNDTAIQPMTSGPVTSIIGVPFLQSIIYLYIHSRTFFPRPHPFSDSRRILSPNVEKFPPKLEFQAARGLGTHPGLESSCLTRFPGRPLDYKKSTNRFLRFNWLKSFPKK